jgi:DNA-directed RNA polymerase subunit E'
MFYKNKLTDHIRLPPDLFDLELKDALRKRIQEKFEGYISKEIGIVIDVLSVGNIGKGVILPGDGAPFYQIDFELLTYKPELQEVIHGRIKDIADFGAFITLGPIEGMIHVSQSMNDYVSFGKDKVLQGKETKRSLKVGDLCRARVIAYSYKDLTNPKLGLTMRQVGLGKFEWLEEDREEKTEKPAKSTKPAKKGDKKK